jgi:hypothetical protein
MTDAFYPAFVARMKKGDMRALQLGAEILNLVKARGGLSVTTNVLQSNSNNASANAEAGDRKSFAALVRKLDTRDTTIAKADDFIDVLAGPL